MASTAFTVKQSGVWFIIFQEQGGFLYSVTKVRSRAQAETIVALSNEHGRLTFPLPPTRPSTKTAAELLAEVKALEAPGAKGWED